MRLQKAPHGAGLSGKKQNESLVPTDSDYLAVVRVCVELVSAINSLQQRILLK